MSKPRIIGGNAKGRALITPKRGTRPTPAQVREALFNMLEFRPRGPLLDLFSGSGAVGLEAASRGWVSTCVDNSRAAVQVIEQNARALGLEVQVVRGDALRFAREHPASFDVVFAAPPYPLELPPLFQSLLDATPARTGGLYIFQHPTSLGLTLSHNGISVGGDRRVYGSNTLTLFDAP